MDYKKGLYNVIKLFYFAILVAVLGTIKMIVAPDSIREYIHILHSIDLYIEHLIISVAIWGLGALLFLKAC